MVHDDLLHLVSSDERDVLLLRSPRVDPGPLVTFSQYPGQVPRTFEKSIDEDRPVKIRWSPIVRAILQPLLHDGRPEPLHLGEMLDKVGHRPTGTVFDGRVEASDRRGGDLGAVLVDGLGVGRHVQCHCPRLSSCHPMFPT